MPDPKISILIVDDDAVMRTLLGQCTQREGFCNVQCAKSGEDAVQRFPVLHPDVVILDVMLPGMDGL